MHGTGTRRAQADVVVVGGGGSGLAAAIEARSLGRSVVLLEKQARLGGTTGRSVGSITATNTPHQLREGILDCPEHHLEDLHAINAKLKLETNAALSRLLVENVGETIRWLMSMGVVFYGPLPEAPHRKPRLHNVVPNSRAFIYHLGRHARRLGVDVRTGMAAERIILDGDRVSGVVCRTAEGEALFEARGGVVLATGDFGGNPDLVARHIPSMAGVDPINPDNEGDGHLMVEALGGRIVHPHLHQGGIRFQPPPEHWMTRMPPLRPAMQLVVLAMKRLPPWLLRPFLMSFLTSILVPDASLLASGAILVNREGRRFADEIASPAAALAKQPGKYAYMLLDGRLGRKFSKWPHFVSTAPGVAYAFIPDYRRSRKDVFREAPTLAGLGARLGMPEGSLERSIAEFNQSLASAPGSSREPFGEGPYIALGPVRHYIQFTDSGVAVDEKLRILRAGDRPIANLFGAGFLGMGGALLWGHGHHLGWAFTSGRLAGRHAAHLARSPDLATDGRAARG